MKNKWLSIGVTPPNTAALFPPSAYCLAKKKAAKVSCARGSGAMAGVRKDLSEDIEKLYETYGSKGFTYKDIMLLYSKDRYFSYKLLATITKKTGILNCKEVPRTGRGKKPSIYSFKPNWKELYHEGL